MRARLSGGEAWVALGIVAVGVFLMIQTAAIEVSPNYARVGPRVFPWIISGVLIVLGLVQLRDALTGHWAPGDESIENLPAFDGTAFLWLAASLVLYLVLIGAAGFPLAAGIMFACVARGFGSRRVVMDIAIGLVLGILVFIGFNYGLGLSLPAGIFSGLL